MKPLNLKGLYGNQYRITYDPSAESEANGKNDPWMFVIPCQYGEIYPHSNKLLSIRSISRVGQELPSLKILNDGDGEAVFLFPPEMMNKVARIVKPRKRRHLSAEHKQKLMKSSECFRFQRV